MDIQKIMASPILWILGALLVGITVLQAVLFFKAGRKEADRLEIPMEVQKAGIRSAVITAIGPCLAACIVLISMITIVGAPTTWTRLNIIGAARSELAMTNLASGLLNIEAGGVGWGITAFTLALWGMALNDFGWIAGTTIATPNMGKAMEWLNKHFDAAWVKKMMGGTMVGIFAYLLLNNLWNKGEKEPCYLVGAFVSAISILLINKLFEKHPRIKELALGISMLLGMFASAAVQYLIIK